MAKDMFGFDSSDLRALEKWAKTRPMEFGKAASGVVNTMAFDARKEAIKNIEGATTTRVQRFVSASMRVDRSRPRTDLNRIEASVGSIDLSKAGRSTGFEELERGGQSENDRVPTLAARTGGNEAKKVKRAVRFNKFSTFHRHTKFKGANRQAKVASMLRQLRSKAIDRKPVVIPRGLSGSMAGMEPGIWALQGKRLVLVNPFDGERGNVKRIAWMDKAASTAASPQNLKRVWKSEADRLYKLRTR